MASHKVAVCELEYVNHASPKETIYTTQKRNINLAQPRTSIARVQMGLEAKAPAGSTPASTNRYAALRSEQRYTNADVAGIKFKITC